MKQRPLIYYLFAVLAAIAWPNGGLAQDAGVGDAADADAAVDSSADVDGEPTVVDKEPTTGSTATSDTEPSKTTVIVVQPPPPKQRRYKVEKETDQEAEAEERDKGSSLVPAGEDAMMAKHPVERGDIAFKPGKGLEVNSADDDFQLRIRVRVQMLYTILKDRRPEGDNAPRQDFRLRRARFIFQGYAFGEDKQYKLEVDPLRSTPVLDYYLDFTRNLNISPRVGQYKLPSNRTRVISSGNLQLVDRSIVNAAFTLDRDQAVDIRSRDFLEKGKYRYYAGIGMGNGINDPKFQDLGSLLYFVRIEYLPTGIFRDYSEVDFARTAPRISIGAAYAFADDAERELGNIGPVYDDGGTSDYHFAYVDAILKAYGFSAITEFMLRKGTRNVGPITEIDGVPIVPEAASNGWGWSFQAGYLLPHRKFEIAGRFSLIRKIGTDTNMNNNYGATFGMSYYFDRHPFKIQADVTQLWRDGFEEGSTVGRIQLQASL